MSPGFPRWALCVQVLLGCNTTVQPGDVFARDQLGGLDIPAPRDLVDQAIAEASHEDALDLRTMDVHDVQTTELDAVDVPLLRDSQELTTTWVDVQRADYQIIPDHVDVYFDWDASVSCEGDLPEGRLAGLHQSCAPDSGVDPEHCRELHFCGGNYWMGTLAGTQINGVVPCPYKPDDIHPARVRSGFMDAYEVSVARFRQYVQAGMPKPVLGENFYPGLQWDEQLDTSIRLPDRHGAGEGDFGLPVECVWSAREGENDDLPINCVNLATAIAFCWWDGMHIPTEVAWEYVARNRGTTETPWGPPATDPDSCTRGDVAKRVPGFPCGHASRPAPIGTHRLGDTFDPLGVHDLYGSVWEWVLGDEFYDYICDISFSYPIDELYQPVRGLMRGNNWFMSDFTHPWSSVSSSRAFPSDGVFGDLGPFYRLVQAGIRCARWEREER